MSSEPRRRYPCEPDGPQESKLDKRVREIRSLIAKGFMRPVKPTRPHYQEDKG